MLALGQVAWYALGMATLADLLRQEIRRAGKRGLSRYRLAKMTGLSQSALSRFVNGETELELGNAELIAAALGRPIVLSPAKADGKELKHGKRGK
jgi:transcriptional regulator with XRE-family HTH domain